MAKHYVGFKCKILVLLLGVPGLAIIWKDVIADMGVALIAILNVVGIQKMKW